MDFNTLWDILKTGIIQKISHHKGLNYFVSNRAKFEGWLKIEICETLASHSQKNITPEKDRIDIVFDDEWALELKTSNTNYRYAGVINKHRPITKNVQSIMDDITALKENTKYPNKAVVFIVFPLSRINKEWNDHLSKIESKVKKLEHYQFTFENKVPGVLYCGLI